MLLLLPVFHRFKLIDLISPALPSLLINLSTVLTDTCMYIGKTIIRVIELYFSHAAYGAWKKISLKYSFDHLIVPSLVILEDNVA